MPVVAVNINIVFGWVQKAYARTSESYPLKSEYYRRFIFKEIPRPLIDFRIGLSIVQRGRR